MKKQILSLMIFAIALCGVAGVILMNTLKMAEGKFEGDLRIGRDGEASDTLEINELGLIPGSQMEYTVHMTSRIAGDYTLTLDFEEIAESPLKDFVIVELLHDGVLLTSAPLHEALEGEALTSACYLSAEDTSDLIVRFKMPVEVGDEAKNLTASFEINLQVAIDSAIS